jgi:hypothetical protein
VSHDAHLHWRKTGKATWQLHLAHVRLAPAHYLGATRLTIFHLCARILVGGRLRVTMDGEQYNIGYLKLPKEPWSWRPMPMLTPVGHKQIEEIFRAALAARALRGEKERLSQNSVQEVCEHCPPTVQVRISRVRRERRALAVWGAWENTRYELHTFWVKLYEERGASPELARRAAVLVAPTS